MRLLEYFTQFWIHLTQWIKNHGNATDFFPSVLYDRLVNIKKNEDHFAGLIYIAGILNKCLNVLD